VVTSVPIGRNVDCCNYANALDANLWPGVCKHFAGKHFFQQDDSPCTSVNIYSSVENRKSHFGFYVVSTITRQKYYQKYVEVIKSHVQKEMSTINSRQDPIKSALTT